jgi:histidinol-phosphate aminotransferase
VSGGPEPTHRIAAVPATTPFVAPEELARKAGHASLLRLGANESAFGASPAALAAMRRELEHTAWYGDPESAELRAVLAQRYGCGADSIVVTSGIDDLLGLAVRSFVAHDDAALATLGTYPTFAYHVVGYGGRMQTVPYNEDGRVSLAALAGAARELRPKIVYLANPDNPSGTFHGRDAVAAFAAALPAGTLLLLDEAYADFVDARDLAAPAVLPRVLRARTFSKAYGMAGARIGFGIAEPGVVATFQKIRLHYGVNRTAQIGALASLDDAAFVAGVVAEVNRGREEYEALGARLGLRTLHSHTNFVCFDCGTRVRAEALVAELLRRAVFIRKPGAPPLDRFVRVTIGTAEERAAFAAVLEPALHAIDALETAERSV